MASNLEIKGQMPMQLHPSTKHGDVTISRLMHEMETPREVPVSPNVVETSSVLRETGARSVTTPSWFRYANMDGPDNSYAPYPQDYHWDVGYYKRVDGNYITKPNMVSIEKGARKKAGSGVGIDSVWRDDRQIWNTLDDEGIEDISSDEDVNAAARKIRKQRRRDRQQRAELAKQLVKPQPRARTQFDALMRKRKLLGSKDAIGGICSSASDEFPELSVQVQREKLAVAPGFQQKGWATVTDDGKGRGTLEDDFFQLAREAQRGGTDEVKKEGMRPRRSRKPTSKSACS